MNIRNFALVGLGAFIVGGLWYLWAPKMKLTTVDPPDIILHVGGQPPELKVTTLGHGGCATDGCVRVKKRETARIKFKLTGPNAWKLKTFKICKGTKNNLDCDLDVWQRMEFTVGDDPDSPALLPSKDGIIDLRKLSAALREFYLFDLNTVEQDYYYTVEACNNGNCLVADPPIENKGRH